MLLAATLLATVASSLLSGCVVDEPRDRGYREGRYEERRDGYEDRRRDDGRYDREREGRGDR
jgi:hypothetical protein